MSGRPSRRWVAYWGVCRAQGRDRDRMLRPGSRRAARPSAPEPAETGPVFVPAVGEDRHPRFRARCRGRAPAPAGRRSVSACRRAACRGSGRRPPGRSRSGPDEAAVGRQCDEDDPTLDGEEASLRDRSGPWPHHRRPGRPRVASGRRPYTRADVQTMVGPARFARHRRGRPGRRVGEPGIVGREAVGIAGGDRDFTDSDHRLRECRREPESEPEPELERDPKHNTDREPGPATARDHPAAAGQRPAPPRVRRVPGQDQRRSVDRRDPQRRAVERARRRRIRPPCDGPRSISLISWMRNEIGCARTRRRRATRMPTPRPARCSTRTGRPPTRSSPGPDRRRVRRLGALGRPSMPPRRRATP